MKSRELQVIPKFMADFIEVRKGTDAYSLKYILYEAVDRSEREEYAKAYDWISANDEAFARAWLDGFTVEFDGFTVEDEQKYYVLDSEDIPLLQKTNNHTCKTTTGLSIYEDGRDNSRFEFTEQEIKDYDERYFAFAVPVEATELF